MLVCSLGDLTLDVVARLERPLEPGSDVSARISLTPGGQAANVAAWVAALGADARFVGKRADDPPGRLAMAGLERLGVELCGPVVPGPNGVVVSIVGQDGDRTMASDRGVAALLEPDELDAAWFVCDWIQISGHLLAREPGRSAALLACDLARAAGARVGVDLASAGVIEAVAPRAFRELVASLRPDVVFANRDEDRIVGGPLPGVAWVLKRGADGCSFAGDERSAHPVGLVVDATGAGDALAAGWLVGGPDLALAAAARCIQAVGSMPTASG